MTQAKICYLITPIYNAISHLVTFQYAKSYILNLKRENAGSYVWHTQSTLAGSLLNILNRNHYIFNCNLKKKTLKIIIFISFIYTLFQTQKNMSAKRNQIHLVSTRNKCLGIEVSLCTQDANSGYMEKKTLFIYIYSI